MTYIDDYISKINSIKPLYRAYFAVDSIDEILKSINILDKEYLDKEYLDQYFNRWKFDSKSQEIKNRKIPDDFKEYVKIEKQTYSNGDKYYILTDLKAIDETYRFESDSFNIVLAEAFQIYDSYKKNQEPQLVKTEDVTHGDPEK